MSKTNDLKELIQGRLLTVCTSTSFGTARDTNMYPHIVWDMTSANLNDLSRDDIVLDIDIWDRGTSTVRIDELSDSVEALFKTENLPQDNILPTFYLMSKKAPEDPDKNIKHRVITFEIQNYER